MIKQPFTNVQLELLKTFSHNIPDDDLVQLKKILANFFAEILTREADRVWDEEGWDEKKVEELLNTKLRSRKK